MSCVNDGLVQSLGNAECEIYPLEKLMDYNIILMQNARDVKFFVILKNL